MREREIPASSSSITSLESLWIEREEKWEDAMKRFSFCSQREKERERKTSKEKEEKFCSTGERRGMCSRPVLLSRCFLQYKNEYRFRQRMRGKEEDEGQREKKETPKRSWRENSQKFFWAEKECLCSSSRSWHESRMQRNLCTQDCSWVLFSSSSPSSSPSSSHGSSVCSASSPSSSSRQVKQTRGWRTRPKDTTEDERRKNRGTYCEKSWKKKSGTTNSTGYNTCTERKKREERCFSLHFITIIRHRRKTWRKKCPVYIFDHELQGKNSYSRQEDYTKEWMTRIQLSFQVFAYCLFPNERNGRQSPGDLVTPWISAGGEITEI